jgi:hypothetical protein
MGVLRSLERCRRESKISVLAYGEKDFKMVARNIHITNLGPRPNLIYDQNPIFAALALDTFFATQLFSSKQGQWKLNCYWPKLWTVVGEKPAKETRLVLNGERSKRST